MIGAAGEAGSIIAGRIQAAAANTTVNVKATGEGPDTGSLKASHNAG
jgi:hypothetical protein